MSMNALGAESPAMKRRWADIGLAPRSSELELQSLPSEASDREQLAHPPSGTPIVNYRTKNNLVVATSSRTTMITERVVISSYYETPAFSPALERTLSEVDELSDDDKSSEEDYEGFSSPRPAEPPAHEEARSANDKGPGQMPPDILAPDKNRREQGRSSFVLRQKIRKGLDDTDVSAEDKYRHQIPVGNDRTKRSKRRRRQSNTKSFEIVFAVMLAIITIVMEPTTNNAPTHFSSPNITFRRSNGTSPLAIEHRRHSTDMLVAPTTKPNELSRKTCERLFLPLMMQACSPPSVDQPLFNNDLDFLHDFIVCHLQKVEDADDVVIADSFPHLLHTAIRLSFVQKQRDRAIREKNEAIRDRDAVVQEKEAILGDIRAAIGRYT